MIAEYKLYHGAVLAELIQELARPVKIDELAEPGRLSSYILDDLIGLQVKHSTQRMNPWPFAFTRQNMLEHDILRSQCRAVFVVFVCYTDGMVCIPLSEIQAVLEIGESDQAWIRIDRRKRQWYAVSGGKGELAGKRPSGLDNLISELSSPQISSPNDDAKPQTKALSRFASFLRGQPR